MVDRHGSLTTSDFHDEGELANLHADELAPAVRDRIRADTIARHHAMLDQLNEAPNQ